MITYIAFALLVGYLLWLFRRWQKKHLPEGKSLRDLAEKHTIDVGSPCGACSCCSEEGMGSGCQVRKREELDYYDDEELDQLRDKAPEAYTPEDIAMVKEVIQTLLDDDLQGWKKSIEKRGITLPQTLESLWQDRIHKPQA